ncbi:uncharacterized protein LOC119083818 [Bradysia coprophila]|uniref:uncharacterized protein LOC119083818 n=1 Tax=Bradysia coprophila TaxID=38358 RepID=UPI00187DC39D|nr:uncharacterized protein LOC119083818 [Bradysia coprophila]
MNESLLLLVAIVIVCLSDTANAFTCPSKGVFPNTDSNDCTTFVICDSSLNPTVQHCSWNTYFWPEKNGCYSEYDCASNSMPGNTDPCEGFTDNYIPDKSSTDCTKYFDCLVINYNSDGGYEPISTVRSQQCSSGTTFRPGYGCTTNYQCLNYECTSEGYFENANVNDCSTFISCTKLVDGTTATSILYPELQTCPGNMKFNPFIGKCDAFYNCDGFDRHGGVDPCLEYNYANPYVPNPYDGDASSYLVCEAPLPGTDTYVGAIEQRECPEETFFSPLLGKCYNNYDQTETCSKDPCSSGPGRYVNYESGHCVSFVECRDETTTSALFEPTYEVRYCPPGTRYSPETSKCNRNYVCPTFPVNYCYPQIPTTTTTSTTTTRPPLARP